MDSFPFPLPRLAAPTLPNPKTKTLFISTTTIFHSSPHPPSTGQYTFCLIDLTHHQQQTFYVTLRPGLKEFLQAAIREGFQIVSFCRAQTHIPHILHIIDPTGEMIPHQIFYDCSSPEIGVDLTLTGRIMDRSVIIVDHDLGSNVNVEPWRNMIRLSTYHGESDDQELWIMLWFFILQRDFVDVRDLLHVCSETAVAPLSQSLNIPLPPTARKTLFLDMDETLMTHISLADKKPDHYDFTTSICYVIKRPGVDELLKMATDHDYEIVVFTAGCREYASPIIDRLDPNGMIAHRLYRDSCKRGEQGQLIKDLSLTGRSLDRCLIVDDIWKRVPQVENVVRIKPFKGDMKDSELKKLLLYFSIEGRYENLKDAVRQMNVWLNPVAKL